MKSLHSITTDKYTGLTPRDIATIWAHGFDGRLLGGQLRFEVYLRHSPENKRVYFIYPSNAKDHCFSDHTLDWQNRGKPTEFLATANITIIS